jgi:hypothetical protein
MPSHVFFYLFSKTYAQGYCSETRDGRNPQPDRVGRFRLTDCSETRDGRNPQRTGIPP